MRAFAACAWVVLLAVACGDQKPAVDARPADASGDTDAYRSPGACSYPSDCADPASPVCCICISPGGATGTSCVTSATTCATCGEPTCEPAQPCSDATKTCRLTQVGLDTRMYWVCR